MTTEHISIPMNAARVCDAIAKIGYSPAAAIMDIIDNSVAAGATRIYIEIERNPDKTYAANDNVLAYRVYDNGKGMSNEQMLNALKLGADGDYPANSLSKYGMGLKSAGLSLGGRINVVSMYSGTISQLNYVDRDVIESMQQYVVCREQVPERLLTCFNTFLDSDKSGTLVEIEKCHLRVHQSAKKTIDQLKEQLGIVYYKFLADPNSPIQFLIKCTGMPEISVLPLDILFLNDATQGFDPDTYDFRRPCLVLTNDDLRLTTSSDEVPMRLSVVLFPKDAMRKHPELTPEERQKIVDYKIKRDNQGFFIYRNGRLIRWGDSLEGLIGRDKIGFRARLEIATDHDDQLHVDVSKQHLNIPEEVSNRIANLIRIPLRLADDVFAKCDEFLRKDEGFEFNERNQDLTEEDYDEPEEPESRDKAKKRRTKLALETEKQNEQYKHEDEETTVQIALDGLTELPLFQRVRYSNSVKSFSLWEAGLDPNEGTFVRINSNHSYYSTVLARLEESAGVRQALEAFVWCCAAAENLTRNNLTTIDDDIIMGVLTKFKKVLASNLDNWCLKNQDIIDND